MASSRCREEKMGKFKCKLGKPCSLGEASPAHRAVFKYHGRLIPSYRRQQGQRRRESRGANDTHTPATRLHVHTCTHGEWMLAGPQNQKLQVTATPANQPTRRVCSHSGNCAGKRPWCRGLFSG